MVPGISRDPEIISMRRGNIPGFPRNSQISRDPEIHPGMDPGIRVISAIRELTFHGKILSFALLENYEFGK